MTLWVIIAQAAATAKHYGYTTVEVVDCVTHFVIIDKSKEDALRVFRAARRKNETEV